MRLSTRSRKRQQPPTIMVKLPLPFATLATLFVVGLILVFLIATGKVPLRYNVRNLVVRWKTTLMTALAFVLVVGLLTVLWAFVVGMQRLTENTGHPDNVIVLSEGATDELFSNLGYSDTGDLASLLDEANRARLVRDAEGNPLISREKYVVIGQPLGTKDENGRQRRSFVQIRGVEDPLMAARVHQLELLPGGEWWGAGVRALPVSPRVKTTRLATQYASLIAAAAAHPFPVPDFRPGTDETAVEAVLGEGVARELARGIDRESLRIGDVFDLGPRKWVVVGIMKTAGTTRDSEVWGNSALVGDMFGKKSFTSLTLKTTGPAEAEEMARVLADRNILRGAAFAAQTEPRYYAALGTTSRQFNSAIMILAFFIGLGGVFGILNTMFAAVSQRTKDIGVLRILGFARWQILVSFFLESLLLATVGGLVGLALGSLSHGMTATGIVSGGQGGGKTVVLKLTVDGFVIAFGILFSLAMGAVGGIFPALSAMRKRPLESMR